MTVVAREVAAETDVCLDGSNGYGDQTCFTKRNGESRIERILRYGRVVYGECYHDKPKSSLNR